jgi:hypothetical protein
VELSASETQQFNVTVTGTTNPAVTWSLNPGVGTVSASGLYAAPASVSSAQTISVVATSVADPSKSASAVANISSPTITLPIEVAGPNGTIESVTLPVPQGANLSGSEQVWMQVHSLRYANKASVQVNNSPWIDINDNTVTYLDNSMKWGGIGGGFNTHKMTVALPPGTLVPGNNTVSFRFNRTAGGVGFRVLKLNLVGSDGSLLVPSSTFVQDDPNTWQPPLTSAADIAAGKQWMQTASIIHGGVPVKAHCTDCHTQDARDFHYFNYSNKFLHAAAMISGLTDQQGLQIASYVRSINFPNPGRPWNPPYQPGPGLDSKPVSEWAAGAGLDAVLDNDSDTLAYVMPGGSTANLAWNVNLNQREVPISLQMPDWNHWLPMYHPMDSFGSTFTNSGLNTMYPRVRAELVPNDPVTYQMYHHDLLDWCSNQVGLLNQVLPASPSDPAWNNPVFGEQIASIGQWEMVKSWEINQEYGLEGMPQAAFGPQAESRAWYSNQAYMSAPPFLKMPHPNPGIGNGTAIAYFYDAYIWYHMQLLLNDGNGTAEGTWPIDRGYTMAYLYNTLTWDSDTSEIRAGTAGLLLETFAKVLQSNDPDDASPYFMVTFPAQISAWSELSSSQKVQVMNAWLSAWLQDVQHYSVSDLIKVTTGQSTVTTPTFNALAPGSFTGDLAFALPQLRYQGVDINLLNQVVAWASSIWTTHNWAADLQETCSAGSGVDITCH